MIALVLLMPLVADVDYNFTDQNGTGWVLTSGKVTVTLAFTKDGGTLALKGKRAWNDAQLVAGKNPSGAPDVKSNKWEGAVDESYPLHDVVKTGTTITFKVDPAHDKLTGSCSPVKATVVKLTSTTLYECTLTGFQWHPVASLPELHHPIVLESNAKAKERIVNTLTGAAKPQFGQRTVAAVKPEKPKKKP
jgi:hypothetical protein